MSFITKQNSIQEEGLNEKEVQALLTILTGRKKEEIDSATEALRRMPKATEAIIKLLASRDESLK